MEIFNFPLNFVHLIAINCVRKSFPSPHYIHFWWRFNLAGWEHVLVARQTHWNATLLLSAFQPNNFNKIWDFTLKSNAKMQYSEFGSANEINFIFVFSGWIKWKKNFVYHTFSSLSIDKYKTVMRNVIWALSILSIFRAI